MDSYWVNENPTESFVDDYPAESSENEIPEVDLTLKLGLPQETKNTINNTNLPNPPPMNPLPNNSFSNMNFNTSPYQTANIFGPVGGHGSHEYQYGTAGQPIIPGFGKNLPMNNEGRIDYGLNQLHDRGNYQYFQNMMKRIRGGVENNFNMRTANFNPNGYNTASIAFPSPPITNEYTLIDIPARRSRKIEIHDPFLCGVSGSAVSIGWLGVHRRCARTYNMPKRCTNFNCGTTETPMWRRGPLGPKTLCNACGIKYRKEEQKRKAREKSKLSG